MEPSVLLALGSVSQCLAYRQAKLKFRKPCNASGPVQCSDLSLLMIKLPSENFLNLVGQLHFNRYIVMLNINVLVF